MHKDFVVITGLARTAQGKFLGEFKNFAAHELGAHAIKAAVDRSSLTPQAINEVIMGCVLPAGQGQAPARQASIGAGMPVSVPCSTVNKVCGSGMKSVMFAHDRLLLATNEIIVAGGMESMSNAPYLLKKARQGYRSGHGEIFDHMLLDGLEDAYDKGCSMGYFAEQFAEKNHFTRAMQDDYAISSFEHAQIAIRNHYFKNEIIPINLIDTDEHAMSVKFEKIPHLPAAFVKNGTVTAGNSSSIADGAAALVLMHSKTAESCGIKPIARILAHTSFAKLPSEFTSAPIDAIQMLLTKLNWTVNDVDLFEVNEAFAVVVLAVMKALSIPREKINVHGGGCALGHPIGATGARIIVTLISALQHYNLKRGIASLCIGGGEATAIAVELI